MLYYLFEYLDKAFDVPGAGLFRYLSFRAAMAIIVSLFITLFLGKRIIALLLKKQVGETIRDLGLEGQAKKQTQKGKRQRAQSEGPGFPVGQSTLQSAG